MNKSWMSVIGGALLVAVGPAMPAWAQSTVVYAAEYNQPTNRFGTIDLLSGTFTRIASIGNAKINDIAYCPTNGTLYGISNTSVLVAFNKTNGTLTKIGNLSTNTIQSLAFRPSDGKLFGATQNRLYTINPNNGTTTLIGSYGNAHNLGSTGQNIRFARDGNLYVSNTSTNTDIYQLNVTNGTATWMGEAIGYPYLMLMNASSNMYGVFVNLGTGTNSYPELVSFDLSSFVAGGTNANGSTHSITINLVGAGTNFPANFVFSGNVPQAVTNLTVPVSATVLVGQTVCPGDIAVFSTTASGTPPYSYVWLKNALTLGSQTNNSLTLINVSTNDAGTYSVIVSGAMGTVTNSATLTVNQPVTVTAAPLGQTAVAGGSATFSVTASGTGLTYQWLFNGSVIGTGSSLTLNNLVTSQAGVYTVIVNGTCNSVTNSAALTVNKATATITLGSLNQTYSGVANPATATTTPSGLGVSFTYNGSTTAPTSAGSYTVVGTINDPNYQGSATGTLVIAQASGSITLENLSPTYNGSARTATATTTPNGLTVTFTYNGSTTAPTSAGSYTVVGTINDPNYQGSATGTLVINPAPLTITATANTKTYDGNTSATTVPSVAGLQGFDTVANLAETYDTQNAGTGKTLNVSAYTVNDGNGGANYTVSTVASAAGVINPATLTVTADNKSRMCGQPNPALTASYSGFISGENTNVLNSPAVLSTTATMNSPAGAYPITASGATAANYSVSYDNGTLTVVQAPQLSCAMVNVGGTGQFVISWPTITNQTYQIESATNLAAPAWTPVGSPLPGTGAVLTVTNNMNGIPQCFFRVELQ
ncbi:MAG TPA: MBG domain-containing protein [Candidatus Sulfopaludibacter sp.]|nr:MBG domain-containing protein [Candidatus Sulfopaludibacter sp.]